ncbi:MAG: hybrid sensor histidine kinase/response regulator [Woeseiaceae bacterium]
MSLPDQVVSYLQRRFFEWHAPVCIEIGRDDRVLRVFGEHRYAALMSVRPGDLVEDVAPVLVGQLSGGAVVLPYVGVGDDHFEVHVLPDEDRFFVTFLDVSRDHDLLQHRQQTANEVRLMHANQEKLIIRLRNVIGELVEAKAELDHRRREAEKNTENKTRFIAMMSHEFRTPLASIINYADLALAEDADAQLVRRSNEAISRASRHLSMLVDTVLDDARIDAGQVAIEARPFSLYRLIEDLAAIMAPLAAEKGLAFEARLAEGVPDGMHADDTGIRQILINLLGNAIKYTETGAVSLDVDWRDDVLYAIVEDTGPGIPADDRERMFQPFERGQSSVGHVKGAGLGLAISLKLAGLMRGSIRVDEAARSGCRLVVELPVSGFNEERAAAPLLPQLPEEHHATEPCIILLCDDDEDMLALAEYYMHQAGYGLMLARDGLEAVEKALAYQPDLILMDINTPRLNGADATNRLRKAGFERPIVALTASDGRYFDQAAFTAYLRKPIQMADLLSEIKSQLSKT